MSDALKKIKKNYVNYKIFHDNENKISLVVDSVIEQKTPYKLRIAYYAVA